MAFSSLREMAKIELPDPLTRRHLVEEKMNPDKARRLAEAYEEVGRLVEAVDFFAKAEDPSALERIRDRAVEEGDPFLLRAACAALGGEPAAEQWRRTADAAAAAGKERYANEARRHADRD